MKADRMIENKENPGAQQENPKVQYICFKDRVVRKRVTRIAKKEGETMCITTFTAKVTKKIKKCNDKSKKNRELIAHTGDEVLLIGWKDRVFIRNSKGIVFERAWEDISPCLAETTKVSMSVDLYKGKTESKDIAGIGLGKRLDREETFILWFFSEDLLKELCETMIEDYPQQPVSIQPQYLCQPQFNQVLPYPQPQPQPPQVAYPNLCNIWSYNFANMPFLGGLFFVLPPTLSSLPHDQGCCAGYGCPNEYGHGYKSFEDQSSIQQQQYLYSGDAQSIVLPGGDNDDDYQDLPADFCEVGSQ